MLKIWLFLINLDKKSNPLKITLLVIRILRRYYISNCKQQNVNFFITDVEADSNLDHLMKWVMVTNNHFF